MDSQNKAGNGGEKIIDAIKDKSGTDRKQKKSGRKPIGRGPKIFLIFLGVFILTMLLYLGITQLQIKINESRTIPVMVDMEIGFPGDGPGQFKEPCAVTTDSDGNFYVSDFSGHRIQKFNANGTPILSIGKEGKGDGEFEQPSGMFVDTQGNLYVCDTFNHRIQKFDPKGKVLKVWSHSFFGPRSIVGGSQNRIYVVDTGNHQIQVFDLDGNYIMGWGGMGRSDGKFREPVGITMDPQGNLYVADSDNLRIQKFDPNGKFLAAFRVSTWRGKNDELPYLAFSQGFLYASNASQNAVLKLDPNGKLLAICRRKDKAGFPGAAGIAVDNQNRVYVVEKGIGKVARFIISAIPSR